MLYYPDGNEVRVGDSVRFADAVAVVETILEGDEIANWGLEAPGFMILSAKYGRHLIEPDSFHLEDIEYVSRGVESPEAADLRQKVAHGDRSEVDPVDQ